MIEYESPYRQVIYWEYKMISHVESFSFTRLDEKTLKAFHKLEYDGENLQTTNAITENYNRLMGYNCSHPAKNKQFCSECEKYGYHCAGHPVKIDVKTEFLTPFHVQVITPLLKVFCSGCGRVVHLPNEADDKKLVDINQFARSLKRDNYKKHPYCLAFVQHKEPPKVKPEYHRRKLDEEEEIKYFFPSIKVIQSFVSKLDANDLAIFGYEKAHLVNLFNREVILLPLSQQTMDERTKRIVHRDKHINLILFLRGLPKDTPLEADGKVFDRFYRRMEKLLIAETEDRISHIQMVKGKDGLIRGAALKKRAKGTARAVLAPDISLVGDTGMGILGCPEMICDTLKHEYVVGSHNIARLEKDATHVIRNGFFIKGVKNLQIGDRVLVSLRDGDYVFGGRYPTLFKGSLFGYQLKRIDGSCFRLNNVNAPHHNADCDGDEFNLHMGGNSASRIEAEASYVGLALMGNKDGQPMTGITYNGIIGCYLLVRDNAIGCQLFHQLISIVGKRPDFRSLKEQTEHYCRLATSLGIPERSGRTLFSMLLPRRLDYKRGDVVIKKGFLLAGDLKKADVANKMISAIFNIERWREPYFFVDKGQKMASYYVGQKGITVGFDEYSNHLFHERKLLDQVNIFVGEIERKKLSMTESSRQKAEIQIMNIVGALGIQMGERVKAFLADKKAKSGVGNLADISYLSGARGNLENVSSAIASLGQLYSKNQRLSSSTRLTPYAPVGSKKIEDNGFVLGSYSCGLSPKEMAQQAIIGREAAWNMYKGVPVAGAQSRQATLHLDGMVVDDQLALVGRQGEIISFLFGLGADTTYTGKKPNPLGDQQSPVDFLAILDALDASP